jgi:1-acyl-sn-glycerol-3-phosphate acyltransferase
MHEMRSFGAAVFRRIRGRHVGEVHGFENLPGEGPFILAHNHGSFMDAILIASICHPHLRTRSLYFISQIFFVWDILIRLLLGDRIRTLPVNMRDKRRVLDRAAAVLERGDLVAIAPEGPIRKATGLRKARTGTARLALRTGVPVVPVGIRTDKCLWNIPNFLRWAVRPKNRADIIFGQPLLFDRHSGNAPTRGLMDSVTGEVMEEIAALIGENPD